MLFLRKMRKCADLSSTPCILYCTVLYCTILYCTIGHATGINLEIRHLNGGDAGNYICEVENSGEPVMQTNQLQVLGTG